MDSNGMPAEVMKTCGIKCFYVIGPIISNNRPNKTYRCRDWSKCVTWNFTAGREAEAGD